MASKQNSQNNGRNQDTLSSRKSSANYQTELLLEGIKEKAGEVVHITINDRTTIELPAHLSPEEREARVANYVKLHKSNL